MRIDGSTKILGLLGYGIGHTLSPKIHNFAAQQLGINCVYLPFNVAPEHLEATLWGLWHAGALGFNITMPHKLAAGKIATGEAVSVNTLYRPAATAAGGRATARGGAAAAAGSRATARGGAAAAAGDSAGAGGAAVAAGDSAGAGGAAVAGGGSATDGDSSADRQVTAPREGRATAVEGGMAAASTDGEGFCTALGHLGRGIESFSRLVLIGTGGANQALLSHFAAIGAKFERVAVLRRSDHHDAAVKALGDVHFAPLTAKALAAELAGGADTLLVQGTSAPLKGEDLSFLVPGVAGFTGTFVDLVYGTPSALYSQLKAAGNLCQDGLGMLIEQARVAQQLWWGQSLPYEDILDHLGT